MGSRFTTSKFGRLLTLVVPQLEFLVAVVVAAFLILRRRHHCLCQAPCALLVSREPRRTAPRVQLWLLGKEHLHRQVLRHQRPQLGQEALFVLIYMVDRHVSNRRNALYCRFHVTSEHSTAQHSTAQLEPEHSKAMSEQSRAQQSNVRTEQCTAEQCQNRAVQS